MRENSGIKAYIDQGMFTIYSKLPPELIPNSIYYVRENDELKIYRTDNHCKPHKVRLVDEEVTEPPLTADWHHGNGVLCCGTIRVARADFDTNPTQAFRSEMFDWICKVLNAEVKRFYESRRDHDPYVDKE